MSASTHPEQILIVDNFQLWEKAEFSSIKNAICWRRELEGDFEEIVQKLTLIDPITVISENDLLSLHLTEEGVKARDVILQDIQLLSASGSQPILNLLKYYERDDVLDFFSTDVYSFHVDRSPIPTETILCTYFGACSDIVPNDHVIQKIHVPSISLQLKEIHSGSDDDFEAFLEEYFFDLHYQLLPDAQIVNLGNGHLWKLAVDHPGQESQPCVHRAPLENEGELRLLLIC